MRTAEFFVLGAVVVSLPFSISSAKKEATKVSAATIQQLEDDILALMKRSGVPGLSIALIQGGNTTWVHGFEIGRASCRERVCLAV